MKIVSVVALGVAGALSIAAAAEAMTVNINLGQSSQDFTLYGEGPVAPGIGSFSIGQGSGVYDSGTNTSTYTMSGSIAGSNVAGLSSGSYSFVTTYKGPLAPSGNAPGGQSNPSNVNFFFYDFLDPTTTMTLYLTGTPSGNHTIHLVDGGNFDGPGFGFGFVSANCSGAPFCTQNEVGLTPGASISGPVDIGVSFDVSASVPEAGTWMLMIIGLAVVGAAARSRRSVLASA